MSEVNQKEFPLVSVVAVCYNHARFVEETLDSIKAQTYPNIQLIIMDDCSQDNSVEVIRNWIDRNGVECVFIPHVKNVGICKTLNEALTYCEGKYVQIIACDDIMLREKLKIQVKILEESEQHIALVYSDAYLLKEDGSPHYGWFIQRHRNFSDIPQGQLFEILLDSNFIPAMSILYKRNIFDTIGGFDEQLIYEDFDMLLRISKKFHLVFSDYVSVKYRLHANNLHSQLFRYRHQNYWIYKKHLDHTLAREKLLVLIKKLYLAKKKENEFMQELNDFKEYHLSLTSSKVLKISIKYNLPVIYFRILTKIMKEN